jgi:hypothetical protein
MKSRPKRDDHTLDLFNDWARPEVRTSPTNDNGERWPCTCDRGHSRFCANCIDSGRAEACDRARPRVGKGIG